MGVLGLAVLHVGLHGLAIDPPPDVVWDTPSDGVAGSMPLGNGLCLSAPLPLCLSASLPLCLSASPPLRLSASLSVSIFLSL